MLMNSTPLQQATRRSGPRVWTTFPEIGVTLFHVTVKEKERVSVYKSVTAPRRGSSELSMSKAITIVPPGSYVRIHSPAFSTPSEWGGAWGLVGGGLYVEADFSIEGVEPTNEWYCAAFSSSPRSVQQNTRYTLDTIAVAANTSYIVPEGVVAIVDMLGDVTRDIGWHVSTGDIFQAITDTQLTIVRNKLGE